MNFRYAPDRTPEEAEARLRELLGGAARRARDRRERAAGPGDGREPARRRGCGRRGTSTSGPKQAWTPVAEFATVGVDAVNLGPGDPQYAHRDDERVEVAALVRIVRGAAGVPGDAAGDRRDGVADGAPVAGDARVEPYPFEELDRRKAEALAAGRDADRLRRGRPARGDRRRSSATRSRRRVGAGLVLPARGGPARAARGRSRAGSAGGSAYRSIPTATSCRLLGSKELVFSPGAGGAGSRRRARDLVARDRARVHRSPSAARGSRAATCVRLPLRERARFLPDLDAVDDATWERTALLWLNYPNNPTGAVAPLAFLRGGGRTLPRATTCCSPPTRRTASCGSSDGRRRRASCRSGDLANVVAINTLSKRSSMTGYRSGFVAGDPDLIAALQAAAAQRRRDAAGVRAAGVASRPGTTRRTSRRTARRYAAKRAVFLDAVRARAASRWPAARPPSTCGSKVPGGRSSLAWALDAAGARRGRSWRPGRSSDRRARGTCGWRWCRRVEECRARRPRSWRACCRRRCARERTTTSPGGSRRPYADRGRAAGRRGRRGRRSACWTAASSASPSRRRRRRGASTSGRRRRCCSSSACAGLATTDVGPVRVPRQAPAEDTGTRRRACGSCPPAIARYGAFLSPGVVMMPSYVNIGAWVGPRHDGRHVGHRRARARRSAPTCTCRAASGSAACSSRCRPRR